jgi:hypothetical protein
MYVQNRLSLFVRVEKLLKLQKREKQTLLLNQTSLKVAKKESK